MKRFLVLFALASLAGCASRETVFRPDIQRTIQADAPFTASGRLSVQMDGKGQVASFEWVHALDSDVLSVNTPIGTTVARLTKNAQGVTLESDGKVWQAPDVESLTQSRLGWSLPLDNLVWWIRGRVAPDLPASYDADGSLLQQGWRIRFTTDVDSRSAYPRRVELTRDNLTIKLVTSDWQ